MSKGTWALFFSGRGSNLEALLKDQMSSKEMSRRLGPPSFFLVSNKAGALACKKAQALGYSVHLCEDLDYVALAKKLKSLSVSDIFLLGYMKILPESFIKNWPHRIYNLHPSLLPKYPGLKSIRRAYEAGDDIGVSIHEVSPGVDEGPVLMQKRILKAGTYKNLSLDEVEAMVHSCEHKMVCEFYRSKTQT